MNVLKRGCGSREVGGTYLVSDPGGMTCGELPVELPEICALCGEGIKQTRGHQYIDRELLTWTGTGRCEREDEDCGDCPFGPFPSQHRFVMLWIGARDYTVSEFYAESRQLGISRRVGAVPRQFKLGDWILLAHPRGTVPRHVVNAVDCRCPEPNYDAHDESYPAVVAAYRPVRVERLFERARYLDATNVVREGNTADEIRDFLRQGVTCVFVETEKDRHTAVEEETADDCIEPLRSPVEGEGYLIPATLLSTYVVRRSGLLRHVTA